MGCKREPTYEADVKPIIASSCVGCHHERNGVPPALETFEDVKLEAFRIRREVTSRNMPPWPVDNTGYCNTWQHAKWLANEDVMTILRWVEAGTPRGRPTPDVVARPKQLPFREDAVVDFGGAYEPGVGRGGNRCFVLDPKLDRDRLLTAMRIEAPDLRGVGQVNLYALDSEAAEREATEEDAAAPGLGYPCAGPLATKDARLVSSWTFTQRVSRHFAGTGVPLHAGRKLVAQVHFDVLLGGWGYRAALRAALELEDHGRALTVLPVAATGEVPIGKVRYDAIASRPVERDVDVYGVVPMMHNGQVMQVQSVATERPACLAVFDHWKFGRQQVFVPTTPIPLAGGQTVRVSCAYRSSGWEKPLPLGAAKDANDEEECAAYLFVAPR